MRDEPLLQLVDMLRTDFRTSSKADALGAELQVAIGLPYRYHPARLAIGLSLNDPSTPPPASDQGGRPIKGEALFGHEEHDLALWLGLLIEHGERPGVTRRVLQEDVAAHWERGMGRLWLRWTRDAGRDISRFYDLLAGNVAKT
ncbi:MAG: DndE family protein [Thioalkalivibrio sp.]|nr:DndE family protein [Thioalkalivibrio sp.]